MPSTSARAVLRDDVDRDREADAFVAARGAGDGRVEANDFAAEVHERPATVAGIDGGIGLNEVLPLEVFVAEVEIVPAFGADDAASHALAQTERAADGEHEVADLQRVAVAESRGGQARYRSIDSTATSVSLSLQIRLG